MSTDMHWCDRLYEALHSSDSSDSEIVDIVEEVVPTDEGKLADNKRKMFIGSNNSGEKKEREFDFVKHVCALSNVQHKQDYRFLFIGFDDDRTFIGIDDWQANGGETVYEIDDSDLQNLIDGSLQPPPMLERHRIDARGQHGVIFVVEKSEAPPVLCTKSTRSNNTTYLEEGVGYIRKGSKSRKMRQSDFRVMIQRREELISNTFESVVEDLNQVVGIPSDQLQNMDLTVSPDEDGPPVREVLSTDAADGIDKQLTVSAKNWNSSGELITDRTILYEYFKRRQDLELDAVKLECLMRSCWNKYIAGYFWIEEYTQTEQSLEPVLSGFVDTDMNGNNYGMIEKVCLLLDQEEVLHKIDSESSYVESNAEGYLDLCGDDAENKIDEITIQNYIEVNGEEYGLRDIVNHSEDGEAALEVLIDELLEDDNQTDRSKLRAVELSLLGRMSGIIP